MSFVIVALWDRDPSLSSAAQSALDAALERGTLVTTATVYAELMAAPGRSESFLDPLFRETGISIDWALDESVWRTSRPGLVTLPVEGNNETRAPAAFWRTS